MDEEIKKFIYIYTHIHIYIHIYKMYEYNEKLFSVRKGVPSVCNNMDETGGHYTE